jgi:DNA helicase-2/ATP-dependent DNA helicase PcrA
MIGDQAQMFSSDDPSRSQPNLTKGLNEPQAAAVAHGDGPILVLAGAGSGKTRVLTHRVAQLILEQGVPSSRILAVTFTNKAAQEMRERLHSLLGTGGENLWITTFHSAGLRILRHNAARLSYSNQFVVYDDQDSKGVLKQVIKDLNINEDRYPLDTFSRAIDKFKNNYILPAKAAELASSIETDLQAQVYDRYQKILLAANAMDFGDLLVNAVRVLREFPEVLEYYRRTLYYILVDEFQDTNKVQYMFIRLLAEPRRNLFVVGDDDQSIYGFRGATISNILEFEKDFPNTKVVKLEQNYRSTGTILNAAHAVIEKNKSRKAKKLWTAGDDGDPIRTFIGYDENQEAEFITSEIRKLITQGYKHSEMAILYRTNAQTRALEESLVRGKIPYKIFGGLKFFDRKEVKDILAYVRLLVNPADNQAFQRVVNTPPRGIGAQAVQAIADEARETSMPFLHASVTVAQSNKHVKKFIELMGELKQASQTMKLGEFLGFIVEKSEYGPRLAAMKDPTAQSRIENLQELESLGRTMEKPETPTEDVMKDLLDRITLTSSADVPAGEAGAHDPNQKTDTVSLMTLHLAKGLEFPVVFLAGMEEGLLPHYRSLDDVVGLEEERRLCYVGITRAMKVLYLTRSHNRGMFAAGGSAGSAGGARVVSRFAKDVDPKSLTAVATERSQGATFLEGYPRFSFDDDDDIDTRIEDDYSNTWRRKKKYPSRNDSEPTYSSKTNVSLDQIRNLLMPADAMKQESKTPSEYHGKTSAPIEQLAPGVEVIHPTFGKGCVESVKGSGNTANVTVKFDSFDEPKKLVYRFAKLVLG